MFRLFFLPFFLSLSLLTGCSENNKKNGWMEEGLKGRVQLIQQRTYSCSEKFGEVTKESLADWGHDEMEFTEQGNIIQKKYFDQQGNLTSTDKYFCNNKNLDTLIIGYSKYGTLTWKQERVFDQKLNLVETKNIDPDGSVSRIWKTEFDERNQEVKSDGYDYSGSLVFQWTYEYDELGNCTAKTLNNIMENRSHTSYYKFDENNNVVEEKGYLNITYKYIYDNERNWTSRVQYYNGVASEIIERNIKYW
jgi:hypothetical protein